MGPPTLPVPTSTPKGARNQNATSHQHGRNPGKEQAPQQMSQLDRKLLLKRGILVTDNSLHLAPLESLLTVNQHALKVPPKTFIKKQRPVRMKEEGIPPFLKVHGGGGGGGGKSVNNVDFGFGPFYHPAYHPLRLQSPYVGPQFPEIDSSIHPQNRDPVHDPKPKCAEFENTKPTGTRWLLQNLPYSNPEKLPEIYQYPGALTAYRPGFKTWATGNIELVDEPGLTCQAQKKTPVSLPKRGLAKLRYENLQTEIYEITTNTTTTTNNNGESTKSNPRDATKRVSIAPPSLIARYKKRGETPVTVNIIKPNPVECIPDSLMLPREYIAAFVAGPAIQFPATTTVGSNASVDKDPAADESDTTQNDGNDSSPPRSTTTATNNNTPFQLIVNGKVNVKVVAGRKCYQFPVLSPKCGRPLTQQYVDTAKGGFSSKYAGGLNPWGLEVKSVIDRANYLYGTE
ncbi:hypothetical protein BDR26DRAFT_651337 [Obelidium mucronatum]|nr:hypothetical protein BDR26DRAFT_651337 [Obelidium mucronatum]